MKMKLNKKIGKKIGKNIKLVLAYMLSYTGAGNECFPSIQTIANDLEVSTDLVIESIKISNELGLIDKKKMYPNDPLKHNNKYILKFLTSEKSNYDIRENRITCSDGSNFVVATVEQNNNSINNNNINNKKSKKTLFSQLKEKYNSFMLKLMKYTQNEINEIIWNNKKEITQLNLLLKRFNTISDLELFLKTAYADVWIKDKCCLPSILNSQYSKILAKSKMNIHEQIKRNEKKDNFYEATNQARKKGEKEINDVLKQINNTPELEKKFNKFLGKEL
jgi:hypothetical protein